MINQTMRIGVLVALAAGAWCAPPVAGPECEPAGARLKITLFSDFECPFCRQVGPVFQELRKAKFREATPEIDFKHFVIHPGAQLAHQAAIAAGEQGKFWEMHDLLFANQRALKREDLLGYARKLGLDMARFESAWQSDGTKLKIQADIAEATKAGVSGTPTYLIQGRAFSGAKSVDEMKQLVETELLRTKALCAIPDERLSKGPSGAAVKVELFADLQSPLTQTASNALDELATLYPSAVRIQFRSYPLSFREGATLAHDAAMAAAAQGRFWEMANYLVDHTESLEKDGIARFAKAMGLNEEAFEKAVDEQSYRARIELDASEANQRGVRGSPALFVNGKRIEGVPPVRALIDQVEAELAAAVKK